MAEKNILSEIAAHAVQRVGAAKKKKPLEEIRAEALASARRDPISPEESFPFEKSLSREGMSFICECKKASPSKGLITPDFPYTEIALDYERAGASAVSVLTEPRWFLGSSAYLKEISESVSIPCLRKDFTVDEYMIFEAKLLGASAVLLICSILDQEKLKEYIRICDSLGLSALVEAHNEDEIRMALAAKSRIIGVNNRNLRNFTIDFENSIRLRKMVPDDVIFVAESGVKTREDILRLQEAGVDAVLIGESLMRAADRRAMLDDLKGTGS